MAGPTNRLSHSGGMFAVGEEEEERRETTSQYQHPYLPFGSLNTRGGRQRFPAGSLSHAVYGPNSPPRDRDRDRDRETNPRIASFDSTSSRKRRAGGSESENEKQNDSSISSSSNSNSNSNRKRAKGVESGKMGMEDPDKMEFPADEKLLRQLNANLKKYVETVEQVEERTARERREKGAAERRAYSERDSINNKTLEEFLQTVTPEEIEELRTFEEKERQYRKQLEENVYIQFAVAVATQTGLRDTYKYVNNVYTKWMNEIGANWSGFVFGGPKSIAESALKTLPFPSTLLYATPESGVSGLPGNTGKVERTVNARQDAVTAQVLSESIRKELYKAILEMRKRKQAFDALKMVSRPSPNWGYADIITLDLRTQVDLTLSVAYTASRDWSEVRPTATQVIRYQRTRFLLAAAVANELLQTKQNSLQTPKSRMDRKEVAKKRNDAIRALAAISTEEIRFNQVSFASLGDESRPSGYSVPSISYVAAPEAPLAHQQFQISSSGNLLPLRM